MAEPLVLGLISTLSKLLCTKSSKNNNDYAKSPLNYVQR